jgi:hypothetical protein
VANNSRLPGEPFRTRADELGAWMRSSGGRTPSRHSEDEHERRLATWRYERLRRLRDGTLSPERKDCLDAVAPGWCPTPQGDTFRAWAEALGAWLVSSGGRVPSRHSEDEHERALARWRIKQACQLRDGTLSPEREECLDAVAPGWRPRTRGAADFHARARAVGQWMVWSDGKVPDGRSDDWYERRLNEWRRRWLFQLRTGTLPSEQEQYLDEVAPGWRPRARSGVDEFPARAEALGRLASADGRVPSGGSDDLHERRIRRWRRGWLFHLRNGTLQPEHEQYLDEVAPGWRPRRTNQPTGDQAARPAVQDTQGATVQTRQPRDRKGVR